MKEATELIYRLEGEAIDEGINVRDLAPILLSLGSLIETSNSIIYPTGPRIAVNVKPFKKGSFEIDIAVFFQSNWQELRGIINDGNVQQLKDLLEWIGLISTGVGGGGYGLLQLLKFLSGRPKTVEQINPQEIRYTNEGGQSVSVNTNVHNLYNNGNVHITINQSIIEPLEKKGIDKIETYLKSDEKNSKVETKKQEAGHIKESLSDGELTLHADDEITNAPVEMYLHPKKVDLEEDGRAWRFRKAGSKDDIVYAEIKDEEFLKTPKHYNKNDLLKVRIVQKQKIVNGRITSRNEIIEVLEYTPAPEQPNLF